MIRPGKVSNHTTHPTGNPIHFSTSLNCDAYLWGIVTWTHHNKRKNAELDASSHLTEQPLLHEKSSDISKSDLRLEITHHEWLFTPHFLGVAPHDFEISADIGG